MNINKLKSIAFLALIILCTSSIPLRAIEGDTDGDGKVLFNDFVTLSSNFSKTTDKGAAGGDFDGNGIVNFADFIILSSNYGQQDIIEECFFLVNVPPTNIIGLESVFIRYSKAVASSEFRDFSGNVFSSFGVPPRRTPAELTAVIKDGIAEFTVENIQFDPVIHVDLSNKTVTKYDTKQVEEGFDSVVSISEPVNCENQ